jgi:hypothetical protein
MKSWKVKRNSQSQISMHLKMMTITRYINIAKCSQFVHKNGRHDDVEYINNNGNAIGK